MRINLTNIFIKKETQYKTKQDKKKKKKKGQSYQRGFGPTIETIAFEKRNNNNYKIENSYSHLSLEKSGSKNWVATQDR